MARLLISFSNVLAEDKVRDSSNVIRKEKDRPFIVARMDEPAIGNLNPKSLKL